METERYGAALPRKRGRTYAVAGFIACMAIVGALLYGVYASSVARTTESECLDNVHHLGIATLLYAQDYDERLPLPASWNEGLLSYVDDNAFRCPTDKAKKLPSYALNRAVTPYSLWQLDSADTTVLLFESEAGKDRAGGPELLLAAARHGQGITIGFLDGGARSMSRARAVALLWAPSVRAQKRLTAEDLKFGEQQVVRMVHDRPEMRRYVQPRDAVWKYCVRQFAGENVGERISWNKAMPDGFDADHQYPSPGEKGYIRVRPAHNLPGENGKAQNCEELWSCAVFELTNIQSAKADYKLYLKVFEGGMTRDTYIRGEAEMEYRALRKTAVLYRQFWTPLIRGKNIATDPTLWGVDIPSTYDKWIAGYTDRRGYPWNPFGKYYDDEVVPYLRATGKLKH